MVAHFYRWCAVCLAYTVFSMAVLIVNHLDTNIGDGSSLSGTTSTGLMSYIFTHILTVVAITQAWCVLTWTRLAASASVLWRLGGGIVAFFTYAAYSGLACIPMSVSQPWHSFMFSAIMLSHIAAYVPPVLAHWTGTTPQGVQLAAVELYAFAAASVLGIGVMVAMLTRDEWRNEGRLSMMWTEGGAMIVALWANLALTGHRILDCMQRCAVV